MGDKFQVGQWVTEKDSTEPGKVSWINDTTMCVDYAKHVSVVLCSFIDPFRWQVGKTYKTTIDGVTAKVDGYDDEGDVTATIKGYVCYKYWNAKTGRLIKWEHCGDKPHLLPYLADESPPVAEAATEFSEFETDESDDVNSPSHYTSHPSGVECIAITEAFNFNVGNAVKYLWRAGLKDDALQDLRKAAWYVQREIERRERAGK